MCPNNCSGRGECKIGNGSNTVQCECSENWKGEACDIPHCVSNCGSPHRGICNSSDVRGCACFSEWQGRCFFHFSSNLQCIPDLGNCRLALAFMPFMLVKYQLMFSFSHLLLSFLQIFEFHRCVIVVSRIVDGFDILCNSFMKAGRTWFQL